MEKKKHFRDRNSLHLKNPLRELLFNIEFIDQISWKLPIIAISVGRVENFLQYE